MEKISISSCLSFGWTTFKQRPGILIAAPFIIILVSIIVGFIAAIGTAVIGVLVSKGIASVFAFAVEAAMRILVSVGVIAFYLKAHDSIASVRLMDLWHPVSLVRFLIVSLVAGILIVLGLVLLIVPGVILSLGLMFSYYLVIDKDIKPIEAIKESWKMTKGHKWQLFLLVLAIVGINLLGLLALIVGLFVSIPVSILAMVHAYRMLSGAPLSPVERVVEATPVAV